LAHHLVSLGVGPEVLVALCTERTLDRVVGIVGVLKAGGAYVSFDPTYPKERLAFLLADARAPVLLTERRFVDLLPESGATRICLDADWSSVAGAEDHPPPSGATSENLAYVVYTSGSTGKPKGVEIPHAGLMNLVRWHQVLYGVRPEDRATQIASPAFDASIWELWPYLAAGASVHIPDEEVRLSSPDMVRWWSTAGITLAYLMTPLAEGVLEETIPADLPLAVRSLIIGGDRLHRGPDPTVGFRLMNHYGPAEYTVTATVVAVPPLAADGEPAGAPSIGRPVDNTQIFLLAPDHEQVPVGVAGELYVAGVGIARGYLRRPELTAEKFLPNPFSAEPGARMYRTGDLVRYLPDGDMDFLGRIDHQVKVRGFRIELGEIEAALAQHAEIREAAVVLREDLATGQGLVAYITPRNGGVPPAGELKAFLKERLPAYMVPAYFHVLERLPLSANGKVDRRVLPAPELPPEAAYTAPLDPLEAMVAEIWSETLGLLRVGRDDNFFDLGGHSVLMIQMRNKLQSRLGREVAMLDLFRHPTLSELAVFLRSGAAARPAFVSPGRGRERLAGAERLKQRLGRRPA
jgi:amino acid adenylation domain-containing protein